MRRSPLVRGDKPLRTKIALKAAAPLARKVGLAQIGRRRQQEAEATGKPAKPALATRPGATGPDRLMVEALLERAGWLCERCSGGLGPLRGRDWHVHHRRPRAAGGSGRADTNSPANLGVLCPDCHGEVEARRAEAQRDGWLVPQGADPADVAVLVERGSRWVYLTGQATYSLHPPGWTNKDESEG